MQSGYELMLVVDGSLNDDDATKIFEKYKEAILKGGGELLKAESWERKKLAYPIRKKLFGAYFVLYFTGPAALKNELQRQLAYEEFVLRSMFLKVEDLKAEAEFFSSLKVNPKLHADLYYELQKGEEA